jgi:hypothetical protein
LLCSKDEQEMQQRQNDLIKKIYQMTKNGININQQLMEQLSEEYKIPLEQ